MFESLIASGPHGHIRTHRYVVSVSLHGVLFAGAVGLTRHSATATHAPPAGPAIPFVAPQALRRLPPDARDNLSIQPEPVSPAWQPTIEVPDLGPWVLPATLPTVADLLAGANPESGAVPGSRAVGPGTVGRTATMALTAAAVDDPVEVIMQPAPRYPSVLSHAGITGRVEFEYVVDTTGHAEAASLGTLTSSHAAFEAAARRSVLATRYRPARLRGRVVRQLVRQTLRFRLAD